MMIFEEKINKLKSIELFQKIVNLLYLLSNYFEKLTKKIYVYKIKYNNIEKQSESFKEFQSSIVLFLSYLFSFLPLLVFLLVYVFFNPFFLYVFEKYYLYILSPLIFMAGNVLSLITIYFFVGLKNLNPVRGKKSYVSMFVSLITLIAFVLYVFIYFLSSSFLSSLGWWFFQGCNLLTFLAIIGNASPHILLTRLFRNRVNPSSIASIEEILEREEGKLSDHNLSFRSKLISSLKSQLFTTNETFSSYLKSKSSSWFCKNPSDHFMHVLQCRLRNINFDVEEKWQEIKWQLLDYSLPDEQILYKLSKKIELLAFRQNMVLKYANLYKESRPYAFNHILYLPWMNEAMSVTFMMEHRIRICSLVLYLSVYIRNKDWQLHELDSIKELLEYIKNNMQNVSSHTKGELLLLSTEVMSRLQNLNHLCPIKQPLGSKIESWNNLKEFCESEEYLFVETEINKKTDNAKNELKKAKRHFNSLLLLNNERDGLSMDIFPEWFKGFMDNLSEWIESNSIFEPINARLCSDCYITASLPWEYIKNTMTGLELPGEDYFWLSITGGELQKRKTDKHSIIKFSEMMATRAVVRSAFNLWMLQTSIYAPELTLKKTLEILSFMKDGKEGPEKADFLIGPEGHRILGDLKLLQFHRSNGLASLTRGFGVMLINEAEDEYWIAGSHKDFDHARQIKIDNELYNSGWLAHAGERV